MTANVTMLLPMLGACAVAMLVPAVTGNAPIYDSLKQQTLRLARKDQPKRIQQTRSGKIKTLRCRRRRSAQASNV